MLSSNNSLFHFIQSGALTKENINTMYPELSFDEQIAAILNEMMKLNAEDKLDALKLLLSIINQGMMESIDLSWLPQLQEFSPDYNSLVEALQLRLEHIITQDNPPPSLKSMANLLDFFTHAKEQINDPQLSAQYQANYERLKVRQITLLFSKGSDATSRIAKSYTGSKF